jgi:hypothetical protein
MPRQLARVNRAQSGAISVRLLLNARFSNYCKINILPGFLDEFIKNIKIAGVSGRAIFKVRKDY